MSAYPPIPCPFPDRSSPHAQDAEEYVRDVARELGITGGRAHRVTHGMGLGAAAALTYPDADRERLRVAALWIAFLVLFDDDWSDLLELGDDWPQRVSQCHADVRRVLDDPWAADVDPLLGVLARVLRDVATIDPNWDSSGLRREIGRYLAATRWEMHLRAAGRTPDLTSYMIMRRTFSTMTVQLELDFFVCRLSLEPWVREHPAIRLADAAVADYGCVTNDLFSLEAERASGLTSNVILVLQHEFGWSLAEATAYAARICDQSLSTFDDVRTSLPALGLPESDALRRYFEHYEAFMSAAARWPARSARYRTDSTPMTSTSH